MVFFRLIGDCHGKYEQYLSLAQEAEYSLQLGDLGFDYSCLKQVDPAKHRCLAGNHDNYDNMQTKHWLGDYGIYEVPNIGNIFFIRGGRSIDRGYRKPGIDWWEDEELSYQKMQEALTLYTEVKPDFVVSHECPGSIIDLAFGAKTWDGEFLKPSMTAKLLDAMWQGHSPKIWFFGHHHKEWSDNMRGTQFHCLPELGVFDFYEKSST
jgi:predicted phosphodiesterase